MSSYSKVAQDPLNRAIKHDKDVPGHEERLLVAWDEEEPGEYTRRSISRVNKLRQDLKGQLKRCNCQKPQSGNES